MAVQPHRISWTDERLDDLNQTVRDGFVRGDREHEAFRQEMQEMRREMNQRFDNLQRTMIMGLISLLGAILATVVAGVIALA